MKSNLVFGFALAGLAALVVGGAACGSSGGGGTGGAAAGGSDGGAGHVGTGGKLGGTGGAGMGGSGVGGAVCTTSQYTHSTLFGGATFDGFVVPANNPEPSLVPMPGVDGGPPRGTVPTLDPTVGSPALGSAKLEIPFSGPGQQLLFAQNPLTPLNLTGTTVTAQIRLDSGVLADPVNSVLRAFLVLKSTASYVYATGIAVNLDVSTEWTTLTVVSNSPNQLPLGYDPCDIREIDVELDTGIMGTYTPGVVHIDSIIISAPTNPDASTDDGSTSNDASTGDATIIPTDAADDSPADSTPIPSDASAG